LLSDPLVHVHEAAHGWFGNGVRISCWEDFALSEGTTTYLAAHAFNTLVGNDYGDEIWADYQSKLERLQASNDNKIVWPEGCNATDLLNDRLFGVALYMKGAFFFKELEQILGTSNLDQALRTFYTTFQGKAASMQDLLDTVESTTGYDPTHCAMAWLRSELLPNEGDCSTHRNVLLENSVE
jgi:aminopeptidase N